MPLPEWRKITQKYYDARLARLKGEQTGVGGVRAEAEKILMEAGGRVLEEAQRFRELYSEDRLKEYDLSSDELLNLCNKDPRTVLAFLEYATYLDPFEDKARRESWRPVRQKKLNPEELIRRILDLHEESKSSEPEAIEKLKNRVNVRTKDQKGESDICAYWGEEQGLKMYLKRQYRYKRK